QQIQNPTISPDQLLEQLEAGCTRMRDENAQVGRGVTHIGNVLREAMPVFERVWSGTGELLGTSWGLTSLDEKTSGMVAGELLVLAARPSVGKTAKACEVALRVARAGHAVLFVSLETSRLQLTQRLLSRLSGIAYSDMGSGYLSQSAKVRLMEAV